MIEINVYDGRVEIGSGCLTGQCIHDVDVHQDYRRQGVGTKIAKGLMALGGSWLWVDETDSVAVLFWRSLGFVPDDPNGERFVAMRIPADKEADHE